MPARISTFSPLVMPVTVTSPPTIAPSAGAVTVSDGAGEDGVGISLIWTLRKNTSSPVPWFWSPISVGAFIRFGSEST